MTTAQVLVLAHDVPAAWRLLRDRLPAAAGYLRSAQQADGHWERDGDDWHTSVTAWALLGLSSHSLPRRDPPQGRAACWLAGRQQADGGFGQSAAVTVPNTYATSYAAAALRAAGEHEAAALGVMWLARAQDGNGALGRGPADPRGPDPSLTAYAAHALSRIPRAEAALARRRCAWYISRTQRPSGAWPAWHEQGDSAEGTAAALRVLLHWPERYRDQVNAGTAFLARSVSLDEPEDWVMVSLAYVFLAGVLAGR